MTEILKICKKHGELTKKQIVGFFSKKRNSFQKRCRQCFYDSRNAYIMKKYFSLDKEQYMNLIKQCNNLCTICKSPQNAHRKGRKIILSLDHNHKTNKVRGLLCSKCNFALGLFKDSIIILESAIQYLKLNG